MAYRDGLIPTFIGGAPTPLREAQKSILRGAAESFFFKKTECDERIPSVSANAQDRGRLPI